MGERAKWIGRNGTEPVAPVARCAVSGCEAQAIATLRVDPEAPRAWLVDLDGAETGDEVCGRHADALGESEGWTVHDVRGRRGRIGQSISAARNGHAPGGAPAELPRVDLRRRPDTPPEELLDATSPLLRRAFAKSREA
ncbi:MAG: hypothetical protein QOI55_1453 [Actinomycetota bacterium]|jgi:hypothetical protein|nr:hypothetical protein [Actinomycetota bacterium]